MSSPEAAGQLPVSPLEALVLKHSPYQTAQFAQGATVIRAALGTPESDDTLTIAPLRGAMPIVWAAEGQPSIEASTGATYVEPPIGEFVYMGHDGQERTTSPKPHQKMQILAFSVLAVLDETGKDPQHTHLALLDEVQKGGTISTAIQLTQRLTQEFGFRPRVRVYASQDSRRRVVAQDKTPSYKQLASNSVTNAPTTVVPMPLIATDRVSLLDQVVFNGDPRTTVNFAGNLTVIRNRVSEDLMRSIGSMTRHAELRHDTEFVASLIDSQPIASEKARDYVQTWFDKLVKTQDNIDNEEL